MSMGTTISQTENDEGEKSFIKSAAEVFGSNLVNKNATILSTPQKERHDAHHNDIQPNDTQNNNKNCDTQHNETAHLCAIQM
jgi:hypothetical protein